MESWYTEWEKTSAFLPDEFYEKAEETDVFSHKKSCRRKSRENTWLRNRNYKFNRIGKLYEFHFVVNDDCDELNTVVFSYSLPNYYIPDFDNKPTRIKRITGEHNYVFGSGEWWKKYKKKKTNRRIRRDSIYEEMPSKNRKYIRCRFRYTFD